MSFYWNGDGAELWERQERSSQEAVESIELWNWC